ncbi:MAG: hypothetical protein ABR903_03645 [Thermodesulfovibrionales bacterium]|jgi:hypothetical protein
MRWIFGLSKRLLRFLSKTGQKKTPVSLLSDEDFVGYEAFYPLPHFPDISLVEKKKEAIGRDF